MELNNDTVEPEYRKDKVKLEDTMVYSCTGLNYTMGESFFPADQEYRQDIINFIKFINPYFIDGSLRHNPVRVYNGWNVWFKC